MEIVSLRYPDRDNRAGLISTPTPMGHIPSTVSPPDARLTSSSGHVPQTLPTGK